MSITFSIPCNCEYVEPMCPFCGKSIYTNMLCCAAMYDDTTDAFFTARDAAACEHAKIAVNVSGANARDIIESLGLEFDDCGSITLAELRGRALVRTAHDDSALPEGAQTGAAGGTFIECARAEGYLAQRASQLLDLVDLASKGGYNEIQWC